MTATAPISQVESHAKYRLKLLELSPSISEFDLSSIWVTPLSQYEDSIWIFPKEWFAGEPTAVGHRSINFDVIMPDGLSLTSLAHRKLLSSIKRALYSFWRHPNKHSIDPSTLRTYCGCLRTMARWVIAHRYPMEMRGFADLKLDDIVAMMGDITTGKKEKTYKVYGTLLRKVNIQGRRGFLNDYFIALPDADTWISSANTALEDEPSEKILETESKPNFYLPYSDGFIAEAGRIWLFYIEELGDSLINCARQALKAREISARAAAICVANFKWKGKDGKPLNLLPFDVRLSGSLGSELEKESVESELDEQSVGSELNEKLILSWPPQNFGSLLMFLTFLQTSCYSLIALPTGGRWSEIKTLTQRCVKPVKNADGQTEYRLNGRTFKLEADFAGTERDWPVPFEVYRATRIQERLWRLFRDPDTKYLFVSMRKSRGRQLDDMNLYLQSFASCHGLDGLLNDRRPHTHRFRKTIARLVVLTLTGAPKILQELFGHSSITMTLHYILSCPAIRAEIENMLDETQRERAEKVVTEIDQAGGKAAAPLRQAWAEFMKGRVRTETDMRRTLNEFIEEMLLGGAELRLIFPGVVCTKPLAMNGPCIRGHGNPNPSRCQVTCEHQIQLPERRSLVRDLILYILKQLRSEDVKVNVLMTSWYQRQLLDQLEIFEDIRREFAAVQEVIVARIAMEDEV